MDKRFFLALVLTVAVILLTPRLFPGTQRVDTVPASTSQSGDAPATVGTGTAPAETAGTPADPGAPGAPTLAPQERLSIGEAQETPGFVRDREPPQLTRVETPVATYQFQDLGASLVSVQLHRFRALRGDSGRVELVRANERLFAFRLVAGGDTIPLNDLRFTPEVRTGPTGGQLLTYTADAGAGAQTIRISYELVGDTTASDAYVIDLRGQVSGFATPAYMLIDMPRGLRSEEADSLEDQRHLAYAFLPERGTARGIGFGKLDPGEQRIEPLPLTWAAAKNKYFIVGLLAPEEGTPLGGLAVTGGARTSKVASNASATTLVPITDGSFHLEVYAGPQEWRRMVALGRDFQNSNPYGGWLQGVVQPFATIVMRILLWLRDVSGLNYGWVLVIFGVVVRLALWPLNQKAMRTSIKMQRLQPHIQEIQKQHKENPQKLQQEMMRVYREHGMTPFSPLMGCLPMLLPMPILFALFFVFQNTIEFRGVSFLWLPDISQKDPFYIVPLAMGASMFLLSWIGMRGVPPNPQTKIMLYGLPIMMTVFFFNFASGLNLYYAVQNVAALPQQWLIANERAKAAPASKEVTPPKKVATPPKKQGSAKARK